MAWIAATLLAFSLIPQPAPAVEMTPAEKEFHQTMTDVVLEGFFTIGDSKELHPDRYVIESVTKVKDGVWRFAARVQYNNKDFPVTINVPVFFAGETPVMSLTRQGIQGTPGLFDTRLVIYKGGYAGTWGSGATGGKMFGNIIKNAPKAQADASSADARLRALYTEEWNWRGKEMGRGVADRFSSVDAASQQRRLEYWTKALATLDTIPFDQLSAEEKINAQIFRTSLRALVSDIQYKTYEAPFNSDTFFWTGFTPREGFANAAAYKSYLARLRDVPRYFDEQIVNMRAGLARGYTVPRVSVLGRDKTIEPYLKGDPSNPLFAPFADFPASMPAAEQAALREEALTVLRGSVVPAYSKLMAMMREEYLTKANTKIGASALPNGSVFYQAQIEKHTTLTLTPQEIHDIGLKEVARLEAEMRATKDRAKFKGTMAEFFKFMRTDPQFYAKTPKELLAFSAYVSKKADDKLAETIGFLPRRRHGIRPVPDAIAPIYTGGRGGLEACQMNTYNLPARPLYTIVPLTLHECTPGHSFQAALALEGPERPAFRRGTSFSGYGEGWGLYVEWLGTVMGIYETPYEDMGRLAYEMWRACRLVIDTGIHQFGWTREQAMSYLRDRAPLAEHEITTEIDRYIAWPGQALAYKLGEIQIRRHRREAEEKLGAKFDQRRFHDAILAIGSVPLPVLEQRMTQFIADESATTKN